jgi:hypothetical protein
MAAFLSEMKSVRLRKVGVGGAGTGSASSGRSTGDGEGRERSVGAGVNGLARSWSTGSRPGALDTNRQSTVAEGSSANTSLTRHGLPSFRSLGSRSDDSSIGEKRKRDMESHDGIRTFCFLCVGPELIFFSRKCCQTSSRLEVVRIYGAHL